MTAFTSTSGVLPASRDFTGPRFHDESVALAYKTGESDFTGKTPATKRCQTVVAFANEREF